MKSAAVHTSIDERPDGRLATVTVDYPERINILGRSAIAALREAFDGFVSEVGLVVALRYLDRHAPGGGADRAGAGRPEAGRP